MFDSEDKLFLPDMKPVPATVLLAAVAKAMKASGIPEVVGEYSGANDEGSFQEARIPDVDDKKPEDVTVKFKAEGKDASVNLYQAIRCLSDFVAERYDSGFENDEGGGGTITFTIDGSMLNVKHDSYYNMTIQETRREDTSSFPVG